MLEEALAVGASHTYGEKVQFLGVVWDGECEGKGEGKAEGKGREQL